MSEYEQIFAATAEKPSQFSQNLADRFGLEYIEDPGNSEDIGLRGRALTVEGLVGLDVHQNIFTDLNAGAGEASAFDAYPIQVDLWLPSRVAQHQQGEARAWLSRLADVMPDRPMLLVHENVRLRASYLPGKGIHEFPGGTYVGDRGAAVWVPWVVRTDETRA